MMENICLLCLKTSEKLQKLTKKALNTYEELTKLKVSDNEKLPKNVCKICLKTLFDTEFFIIACRSNYLKLVNESEKNETEKLYVMCNICDRPFPDETMLKNHQESEHIETVDEKCVEIESAEISQSQKCKICNKTIEKKDLINHVKEHLPQHLKKGKGPLPPELRKKYTCEVCQKIFNKKCNYEMHIAVHKGEKVQCHYCGLLFNRGSIQGHIQRKHEPGKEPKICPICEKVFPYGPDYQHHEKTHFIPTEMHNCNVCGKDFLHIRSLKEHMLNHTGETPFKCETCGKGFVKVRSKNEHVFRVHMGKKPFGCEKCYKRFFDKSGLKKHLKNCSMEASSV